MLSKMLIQQQFIIYKKHSVYLSTSFSDNTNFFTILCLMLAAVYKLYIDTGSPVE